MIRPASAGRVLAPRNGSVRLVSHQAHIDAFGAFWVPQSLHRVVSGTACL
jgi:hypothetical protein